MYVNDTIDIAGMGHGQLELAWFGKYGEFDDPQYIYKFSLFRSEQENFWLNPDIFASRTGPWYQFYGNTTEPNGNLEAFRILNKYRNQSVTYPNGTTIDTSEGTSNQTPDLPIPKPTILPEIPVSDYVVAHGDPLSINTSKLWVFGRVNSIYNSNGNLTINQILSLEDGSYKIVSHEAGNNTIFEVGYNPSTKTFTSPWKNVQDVSIYGSQPMLDIDRFYQMIRGTDDKIETYNLVVEEPAVTVVSIDEVDVGNRIPIAWEPGMTLLDIRGYSNVRNDTTITLVMDPQIQTARTLKANTYTTQAIQTSPGNKSMYQIYIPINKNEMPNGMHTISVTAAIGGSMLHDFPISELPADSYVPNATLKYIGDRNPWVPTPTPEVIIQKEMVPVPGPVVTVVVTPSDEQVRTQQEIVQNEKINFWIPRIITAIIGLIVLVYLISVWLRRKER